ncbi:hypothetical protein LINPERPRIM_LOCUS19166 [Linum perenne]
MLNLLTTCFLVVSSPQRFGLSLVQNFPSMAPTLLQRLVSFRGGKD